MSMLRHPRRTAVWLLAVSLLAPLAAQAQGPPCLAGAPSVGTSVGPICGLASKVTIQEAGTFSASAFLGIPYAQPPVGPLRWQSPEALSPLPANPFPATRFGNECPQSAKVALACTLAEGQDEDCLYLNVWAPSDATPAAKYPVMAFIHGGAFITGSGGSSTSDLFDGTYLAATAKVVVVTFNYRLGVLGFLSLAKGLTSNNFGLQDQVHALSWVQQNIASFGGDPGKVTIFGESAGAMSVGLLTFSSQPSNLFQAAMMESNPLGLPYKTTAEANTIGDLFSQKMGCYGIPHPKAECMAGKSACALVRTAGSFGPKSLKVAQDLLLWAPAIDGTLLNGKQPAAQGAGLPVPLVLGTNQSEGTLFAALEFPLGVSPKQYAAELTEMVGSANLQQVQQVYPCATTNCSTQLAQVLTDYVFSCANRHLAIQAASATGAKAVYAYEFTQESNFDLWKIKACAGKVCHGDELPYVFNTAEKICQTFTADEEALSQTMGGYWTAFGAGEDPNGGSRPDWPLFGGGNSYLTLVQPPSTATDPFATAAHCTDLWDGIGYPAPGAGGDRR